MEMLTIMDKKQLEKIALEILENSKIDYANGYDIVNLATFYGFFVGTARTVNDDDGFIIVDEDATELMDFKTNRIIVVNPSLDLPKKRFVIAHELGHYFLNFKAGDKILAFRDSGHGRTEEENDIDFFAACLLMPSKPFKAHFNKTKEIASSIEQLSTILAAIFTVPYESVRRRIAELGLSYEV